MLYSTSMYKKLVLSVTVLAVAIALPCIAALAATPPTHRLVLRDGSVLLGRVVGELERGIIFEEEGKEARGFRFVVIDSLVELKPRGDRSGLGVTDDDDWADGEDFSDRNRLHLALALGFMGSVSQTLSANDLVEVEAAGDLETTVGGGLELDLMIGRFVSLGPHFYVRALGLENAPGGRSALVEFGPTLKLGVPFGGGRGWAFLMVPLGVTLVVPNDEAPPEAETQAAFHVGVGVGATYRVAGSVGLFARLGYLHRRHSEDDDVTVGKTTVTVELDEEIHEMSMEVGFTFAL